MGAATSSEKTGLATVVTGLESLLPAQTPTLRAYSPRWRPRAEGGAM